MATAPKLVTMRPRPIAREIAVDARAARIHRSRDRAGARQAVSLGTRRREQTCGIERARVTVAEQHGRSSEGTVTVTDRCAIYARFSSEKQNALSIDQQIRKCREYADRSGLRVLEQFTFTDHAISGATDDRAGLQRLLARAKEKPSAFDVILVDDTSRLSRKLSDALRIKERLDFAGIRVIFVSQGFDSSAPQSQTLLTVHGLVDGLYLDGLREKTFRGVEQLALQGLHTGGRVFGYRHIPIESSTRQDSYGRPAIEGVRLAIDPNQAPTVRRIFERYAGGHSMKRIAIDLNRDGVLSPQPRDGSVAELGSVLGATHLAERALSRRSHLGQNEKNSLARNRKANLSAKARKRMAPWRNSRATDRLRGIVESHA